MKKLFFVAYVSMIFLNSLLSETIILKDGRGTAEFSKQNNYVLTSLRPPEEDSILKRMELIFHYAGDIAMYYIGESSVPSRFGKDSDLFRFRDATIAQEPRMIDIKAKNQNLEVRRNFAFNPETPGELLVHYSIKGLKDTLLGPHTLCPSLLFGISEPVIIFGAEKIVDGSVKKVLLEHREDSSVRCMDWVIVFDQKRQSGLAISSPGTSIGVFKHKTIGSEQEPLWTAALRPGFLKGHFLEANSDNRISLSLLPFSGDYRPMATKLLAEFNDVSLANQPGKEMILCDNGLMTAWTVGTGRHIVQKGEVPSGELAQLKCSAAGNETITVPILLRAKPGQVDNLSIVSGSFVHKRGHMIPAESISWYGGEWYDVTRPTYSESVIGTIPDALTKTDMLTINEEENALLWLKIAVPPQTPAGIYRGDFSFKSSDGRNAGEIEVALNVFDFSLPETRNFPVWSPVWSVEMNNVYGAEKGRTLMPRYHDNLLRHRAGMWASQPVLRFVADSCEIELLNWVGFERDLDLFFNHLKMPYAVCRIFRVGGAHRLIGTPYGKVDEMFTPLWIARYQKMAEIMKEYEKRKGIEGRLIYELYDEPYDEDNEKLIRCSQILREAYPDIKLTFWSGRGFVPAMLDHFNVWTVSNRSFNHTQATRLQQDGTAVWIYNPIEFTDLSLPPGATRRLFWYLWSKNVDGLFFWNITAWREWGGRYGRPNRDSTFLYPGEDGPINTIRWERFRDGLQDYEYIRLLSKAVENVFSARNALEADKATAGKSAKLIEQISRMDFTLPETTLVLDDIRGSLASKIEKLKEYLPSEKTAPEFIVDKPQDKNIAVMLRLTPKDFPALNRAKIETVRLSGKESLSTRLFTITPPPGKSDSVTATIKFNAVGSGSVTPSLWVRFSGQIGTEDGEPVVVATGKPKQYIRKFRPIRISEEMQLRLILESTGQDVIEIEELSIEITR